jgi:hypothetical protein
MKTRLNSIRRPRGFTYVTVVVTMIVVGLMLAAYLKLVAVQNQLTMRSQVWNRSVPVLEAGIEEALAHLNKNASPDAAGNFNPQLTADSWIADPDGGWHKLGSVGGDFYYVKISAWPTASSVPGTFPFVYSTGYVQQVSAFALNRLTGPFVASSVLDQLVAQGRFAKRIVEATTTNVPTFTKGLVTKKLIDLNGRNVFTDSYNSTNSAYSTNGRWDPTKALDHGDIASNDTIVNSVNIGNATVRGTVSVGPQGTVAIGSGVVGDASFVSDPANAGTIQAGHFRDDMNVEFVDPAVPVGSAGWTGLPSPFPTDFDADGDGVLERYQYVLNGGSYLISGTEQLSSKSILIMGNVQIRVDTRINLTGQDVIRLNTNATLKIYANCADVTISGNGVVNPGTSTSLQILGTPVCTSINLGGNAEFAGTIDAPNAHLDLNGSGASMNDFSGAAKVKSARFNGNFRFHYDEALPKIGAWRGFVLTSWNER